MKSTSSVLLMWALTLNGNLSWAKPKLDPTVSAFLNSPSSLSENSLPVILTYKIKKTLPLRPHHPKHHADIQKALMKNTLSEEASLFGLSILNQARPSQTLWIINSTLTSLNYNQLKALSQSPKLSAIQFSQKRIRMVKSPVSRMTDFNIRYTYGLEKFNVPTLRTRYPKLQGTNVRVGILDTGIDAQHPDLKGKVKVYKNFSPAPNPTPSDEFGHGTHVAGTIAGGSASGLAIGVAPQADLIVGRIFDANGNSTRENILLAMQWMADPDGNPDTNDFAQVVNSSWSDDEPYSDRESHDEPFCQIIDSWVQLGMIPVFSAGNTGPSAGTINIPAGCPRSFAVGATEIGDRSPHFSSTGPVKWKSTSFIKPDVAAPGFKILSATPGRGYEEMSGTSMAAPHVSGALAVVLQARPDFTVEQATQAILAGIQDLGNPGQDNVFGWGRPNLLKSIELITSP